MLPFDPRMSTDVMGTRSEWVAWVLARNDACGINQLPLPLPPPPRTQPTIPAVINEADFKRVCVQLASSQELATNFTSFLRRFHIGKPAWQAICRQDLGNRTALSCRTRRRLRLTVGIHPLSNTSRLPLTPRPCRGSNS